VSYNDYFSPGNASVLRLCGLAFSQPCIVVTEPKPDTLGGWQGVNIQGVRAVEPTLGHWTSPDAYSGSIHDPASQKPYMYERNNSYVYSDPSGYDPYVIFDPDRASGNGHLMIAVMNPLLNKGDSILTEHTTAEQDAAMNKRAEALIASNHNYNLITCNCDEFVKDVLSAADPQAASALTFEPRPDFDRLKLKGWQSGHPGMSPNGFQDARFRR